MTSLDLALIGNGTIGALVDGRGNFVWTCFPRFDGDPQFCTLLRERDDEHGFLAVELLELERVEQEYVANTPVLVTRLHDRDGGAVEITDFAPRFPQHGRMFCPMMLIRRIRPAGGQPRVRIRVRPSCDYGRRRAPITYGSNHVRYEGGAVTIRLTTDVPITSVVEESAFLLEHEVTLLLGPDETVAGAAGEIGRRFYEETSGYWRDWVRALGIPFEWQDAVIRAAITLELNVVEDTGAIIAAMTTSIPESADSGRNWDYRYCWLRDGYHVVDALNRLAATRTMERYLTWIVNLVAGRHDGLLQPVYAISGRGVPEETVMDGLAGYRGMGPVRAGNQASQQVQHDAYGSAILAATHVFFDRRLHAGDEVLFRRLEPLGDCAARLFDQPDAGLWELRGTMRAHTFSGVMCWAGCDRLARIAAHLGLAERAAHWRRHADRMHGIILDRAWNAKRASLVSTMDGGDALDASLLRLGELGFLAADDPRFAGTVLAIERELRRGDFVFRYVEADDFGAPKNAFLACSFWFINALAAIGRRDEARAMFENVLGCRNRHGLLSEHIDPATREQWGNFVQTFSMVGLVDSAIRLSIAWDQAF